MREHYSLDVIYGCILKKYLMQLLTYPVEVEADSFPYLFSQITYGLDLSSVVYFKSEIRKLEKLKACDIRAKC